MHRWLQNPNKQKGKNTVCFPPVEFIYMITAKIVYNDSYKVVYSLYLVRSWETEIERHFQRKPDIEKGGTCPLKCRNS